MVEQEQALGQHGLRSSVVSNPNVFAQAVAGIGPSVGAGALIPLLYGVAVGAAWLTVLIGTLAMVCIGICIAAVAREHPSAGVFYELVPRGLGKDGALIAGATTVAVALALGPFGVILMGLTLGSLLNDWGVGRLTSAEIAGIGLVALALLTFLSLNDIRLSTKVFFRTELASISVIMILCVVSLIHHGNVIDSNQLSLSGTTAHGAILGVVFVVLAFGGFEGSAALGIEAKNPKRAIPIALIGSVAAAGIFLAFNAYAQVASFKGTGINLATDSAPFSTMAQLAGVKWLGELATFGVFASVFAATAAWLNYGGRVTLVMAHDNLLPKGLRHMSEAAAPHRAILILACVPVVVVIILVATGSDLVLAFGDISTLTGYGLTLMYLLIAVAAPVWLWRVHRLNVCVAAAGLVGAVVMVLEFYYSFHPTPAYPINVLMYGFFAFVGLLVLVCLARRLGLIPDRGPATAIDVPPDPLAERLLEASER
jgi:amino acid transporter